MKIILSVLLTLTLTSCLYNDDNVRKCINTIHIRGHRYLMIRGCETLNGFVHDPDCPCHLDTLDIWVDKNDTIYRIRKK